VANALACDTSVLTRLPDPRRPTPTVGAEVEFLGFGA
jgi:hypothetical protein